MRCKLAIKKSSRGGDINKSCGLLVRSWRNTPQDHLLLPSISDAVSQAAKRGIETIDLAAMRRRNECTQTQHRYVNHSPESQCRQPLLERRRCPDLYRALMASDPSSTGGVAMTCMENKRHLLDRRRRLDLYGRFTTSAPSSTGGAACLEQLESTCLPEQLE